MVDDDPYFELAEEIMPFPEEVVGKRKRRHNAGISSAGIPIVVLTAGLHYLGARFMAARAFKIFRQPSP